MKSFSEPNSWREWIDTKIARGTRSHKNRMRHELLMGSLFCLLVTALYGQVNIEKYRQDQEEPGLSGRIGIDFSLRSGNSDVQQVGSSGRFNYNAIKYYAFFVFKGDYGWNNGKEFSNEMLAHLRVVKSVHRILQWEGFVQWDYNKTRRLLDRELLGSGIRFKVLKTEFMKTRLGIGYFYERERFDLPSRARHPVSPTAHRSSNYLSNELNLSPLVTLTSIVYYQPQLGKARDLRVLSENVFYIDLGKYIDLTSLVDFRYDSMPPDGKKKMDVNHKIGLAIRW